MSERAPCSELPNDNPGLHAGAIWRCQAPCAVATSEASLPAVVDGTSPAKAEASAGDRSTDDDEPIEIVDDLAFDPASIVEEVGPGPVPSPREVPTPAIGSAAVVASTSPATPSNDGDPFAKLVAVLADVARASGAGPAITAGIPGLLGAARLNAASMTPAALDALVGRGLVERTSIGVRRGARLAQTALAWQAVLRAESEDFTGCGAQTLDEWAADLLACILGNPSLAGGLRRELRRRGVAAFGLLAAA